MAITQTVEQALAANSSQSNLAAILALIFASSSESFLHDPGSLVGRLGQTLYGDDHDDHWTTGENGTRVRATGSGHFENPEAQKVFKTLTNAASAVGVPRDLLFKFAWNAKDGPPMMGSGAQGENILNAADYLENTPWGRKLLDSNPQLRELTAELDKAVKKYPDKDILAISLSTDPSFRHLQELIKDPQLGALVTSVNIRQVLVEKYKFDPESAEPLSPEVMRQAGGEILLDHHFGKRLAKEILAHDDPNDTSPFFTEERLKAHPGLKLLDELKGKSAHQIVAWAQDKMSVDVSPLLQAAYAHPTAVSYNEIDAQIFQGVSMAALKASIRGVETNGYSEQAAYRVVNSIGAVGKYQIMDFNIETKAGVRSWPEEALGIRMTVQQVRNDPAAQEAMASYMFQKYAYLSWRRHNGNETVADLVKDVASYWQSGISYDQAVARGRRDKNISTATYAARVLENYNNLPHELIAMTKADPGAPKAIAAQLSLKSLGLGTDAPTEPKTATTEPVGQGKSIQTAEAHQRVRLNHARTILNQHAPAILSEPPAAVANASELPKPDGRHSLNKLALETHPKSTDPVSKPTISPSGPIAAA